MACKNHPDRDAVGKCATCGADLCAECAETGSDHQTYCAEDLPTQAPAVAPAAAAPAPTPAPAPAAAPPPAAAPAPATAPPASGSSNMVLAAIGYLIWICSLIAMLVEKNDQRVKFHAWNGLYWGIAQMIVAVAIRIIGQILRHAPGGGMLAGALGLLPLVMFVFSIIFLVKALNRQDVNIPVISDMARKQVGL